MYAIVTRLKYFTLTSAEDIMAMEKMTPLNIFFGIGNLRHKIIACPELIDRTCLDKGHLHKIHI